MAQSKVEYPALDAQPVVIYGLSDPLNGAANPILQSNGTLLVSDSAGTASIVGAIQNITVPAAPPDEMVQRLLGKILQMISFPISTDMATFRQRGTVIVESGTVVTNSTINTMSGYSTQELITNTNLQAWALCCRERIT
jgi:hypothetical protein